MGRGNTKKYDRAKVVKIISEIGFQCEDLSRGKGDHRIYYHTNYKDLKLTICHSASHSELNENEMADICKIVLIAMNVLQLDTSIFKAREGIEGAFRNYAKRNPSALFDSTIRRLLGLETEQDVLDYLETAKKKYAIATETDSD